jgi:mannosyltransferase
VVAIGPPATTESSQEQRLTLGVTFGPLALAIILGLILRSYRLGADSLWVDEFATLGLILHPPGEILRLSSQVNFIPPLYFLLVHGVYELLGASEVSLRLLSVFAGVCTIPVVWLLTQELTSSRQAANTMALLLAVNPLHLWYSQEARPYSLLLFFGASALLALERAVRRGRPVYWIGFSVCLACAFLTHSTGVMFALVGWIWTLWSPERRRFVRPLLLASLGAGLFCLPFGLAIAQALVATHGTFHSPPRAVTGLELPYTLLTYLGGYSFGPAPRDIQNLGASAAVRAHLIQTIVAAAVLMGIVVACWRYRNAHMLLYVIVLAVFLVGMFVLSLVSGKAYNVRYTVPGMVGLLGVVSIQLSMLPVRFRLYALCGLMALSLWADGQWFWASRYWKEDSRAAVQWLRAELPAHSIVAVAPSYSVGPLEYYSQLANIELRYVPVSWTGSAAGDSAAALVLTRLHHVPNWRELRSRFLGSASSGVLRGQVAGYELLIRSLADTHSR